MISICVPFYPYYREHDRTEEIFSVMIAAMNRCARKEELELSIADGGLGSHDTDAFKKRIKEAWQGKLVYSPTKDGLTPRGYMHEGKCMEGRVWIARLVEIAVMKATEPFIFINNIDIEIPIDFVDRYEKIVAPGKVWFPMCYHLPAWATPAYIHGGWRSARGLVCITKQDYIDVGGTDYRNYIKNRHDSDLFNRISERYQIEAGPLPGLLHRDHPGCAEGTSHWGSHEWPPE